MKSVTFRALWRKAALLRQPGCQVFDCGGVASTELEEPLHKPQALSETGSKCGRGRYATAKIIIIPSMLEEAFMLTPNNAGPDATKQLGERHLMSNRRGFFGCSSMKKLQSAPKSESLKHLPSTFEYWARLAFLDFVNLRSSLFRMLASAFLCQSGA